MGRLTETCFTETEKSELQQKIAAGLKTRGVDSVLVVGASNITYLTPGLVFPYIDQALIHPVALFHSFKTDKRILACTFDLSDITEQLGWQGETLVYELTEATPEQSLAAALSGQVSVEDTGATIGYDGDHMTGGQLEAFEQAMGDRALEPVDGTLQELRLLKTDAEARLLEIAGRMGDRGFISALNHAEGAALDTLSYPMWEYGERFRVHAGEFGASGVGNLSVLQGPRGRDLYNPTGTRETFHEGEILRMEYSVHNYGYWSTGARTVFVGTPDAPARKAWAENLALKRVALDALRPGHRACDVHGAVVAAGEELSVDFWHLSDVGHGVGAAEREAPYLAPYDDTELACGMVIVVAVYTRNEKEELIGNKDTYLVTEEGPELLTWYKNWDKLYALHGTSARHG